MILYDDGTVALLCFASLSLAQLDSALLHSDVATNVGFAFAFAIVPFVGITLSDPFASMPIGGNT